jgi:hypothetical protein
LPSASSSSTTRTRAPSAPICTDVAGHAAVTHFEIVATHDDFLELQEDAFATVMRRDDLHCTEEKVCFL